VKGRLTGVVHGRGGVLMLANMDLPNRDVEMVYVTLLSISWTFSTVCDADRARWGVDRV
jgi:hypothetical protein